MSYEVALKNLITAMHTKMAQGFGNKKVSVSKAISETKEDENTKPPEKSEEKKPFEMSEELMEHIRKSFGKKEESDDKETKLVSFGKKPAQPKKKK